MIWNWIDRETALALHERLIAEHGGVGGVRDFALLDSALARPRQSAAYGEPGLYQLAAAYAFGIARNHPFLDGNKRTAFVLCALFLRLHGRRLMGDSADRLRVFVDLGQGRIAQEELAGWTEANTIAL